MVLSILVMLLLLDGNLLKQWTVDLWGIVCAFIPIFESLFPAAGHHHLITTEQHSALLHATSATTIVAALLTSLEGLIILVFS